MSTRSLDLRAGAEIILADIKGLFKPEGLTRRSARFAKLAVKRGNFIRLLLQYDAGNVISPRKPRLPCHETEDDARFIVIFFTCAKHFRFIRIALASLQVWKPLVKTVYVYVDRMDPMSEAQCELLRKATPVTAVFRLTRYPMSWGGLRVILNELRAFAQVGRGMKDEDFLVKLDSDVICLSDAILQYAKSQKISAMGTSVHRIHGLKDNYLQGGCYIINAIALRALLGTPITKIGSALVRKRSFNLPEDEFISTILKRAGIQIVDTDFLYYSPALVNPHIDDTLLDAHLDAIPSIASVLHFEGEKANMTRVAKKIYLAD
jgi:hypothetical protein